MKTLFLVRHAKSDWTSGENDIDRPLNQKGLVCASMMSNILSEQKYYPDLIISSPAVRAKTTADIFAANLNYPIGNIVIKDNIYMGASKNIMDIVNETDNSINNIFVFCHNPVVTSLSCFLTGKYIDNVPTCGIVCIDFQTNDWSEASSANASLRFFDYPKKHL